MLVSSTNYATLKSDDFGHDYCPWRHDIDIDMNKCAKMIFIRLFDAYFLILRAAIC